MKKVRLEDKFALVHEHWVPKIVGELNGQHVKIAKLKGEFIWHHHEKEDELFLVIGGRLNLELRDRVIELEQGEFLIVPAGIDHRPVAPVEAHVLLLEPASTTNTGNVEDERTLRELDWI